LDGGFDERADDISDEMSARDVSSTSSKKLRIEESLSGGCGGRGGGIADLIGG
jgi:hypothetical protein